jgi:hypothetical protein
VIAAVEGRPNGRGRRVKRPAFFDLLVDRPRLLSGVPKQSTLYFLRHGSLTEPMVQKREHQFVPCAQDRDASVDVYGRTISGDVFDQHDVASP